MYSFQCIAYFFENHVSSPHWPGVPLGGGDELELLEVIEVDVAVVGGRGQKELVRVELDVVDGAAVVVELRHQFAGAQVPNLQCGGLVKE